MRVLVVGGSIAGLSVVRALRSRGFGGEIDVVSPDVDFAYDRPPLSKAFLQQSTTEPPWLSPSWPIETWDLRVHGEAEATRLAVDDHVVGLADGREVNYDRLVIATGSVPRRLRPGQAMAGLHVLRTLEDARALRCSLDTARRAVIVGGGFIGAEVAASARSRDVATTILERDPAMLAAALGARVGDVISDLHRSHGVEVLTNASVESIAGDVRVEGVVLEDGTTIDADLVVEGLGATPATDWLRDSGLTLADGIVCDESLRAVGQAHVFAAGDVARWPHALLGRSIRIEHWTNAFDHGEVVAAGILGLERPPDPPPYVWSDQYDDRLQVVGLPAGEPLMLWEPKPGAVVACYGEADRLSAVFALNFPKAIGLGRRTLLQHGTAEDLRARL